MIKFAEELEIIKALERRQERASSGREWQDLRREIRRRKREYASAVMYYREAQKKRNEKDIHV